MNAHAGDAGDLGLRLTGVAVDLGGRRILEDIALAIRPGRVTALLGPSGAGKTTLLRLAAGLIPASSGIVAASPGLRRAMMFQEPRLIGRLSALDNVLIGRLGSRRGLAALLPWPWAERQRAITALARVGLLDKALSRCDRLSGGERQRVALARALVQEPQVLLADEPVAHLDPPNAERIAGLLRGLNRETGLTLLVGLHQIAIALAIADDIVVLARGRIRRQGARADFDEAELRDLLTGDLWTGDDGTGERP